MLIHLTPLRAATAESQGLMSTRVQRRDGGSTRSVRIQQRRAPRGGTGGPPLMCGPYRRRAKPGLWTWTGPQDGLGQVGLRLKWAKGRFGSKNDEKVKVLRMGLPIVESLSGLQESTFSLLPVSRRPQLHFGKK